MGASPGAALALTEMNADIDVRHVLPAIRVPTLVIHRTEDRCLTIDEGRYVAAHIPGARLVELPGDDHLPFVGDQDAVLAAIEQFLDGRRKTTGADRVLSTILSATLVTGSSKPDVREAFDVLVRKEVDWYRGRLLDLSADRIQAAFDGPARAIRCAVALAAAGPRFRRPMQVGLHTGECESDGRAMRGAAVDLSTHLSRLAPEGSVLVSGTVRDLVAGSGLVFESRGAHRLGNDAREWDVCVAKLPLPDAPAAAR